MNLGICQSEFTGSVWSNDSPSRATRNGRECNENQDGNEQLEDDNQLPIPLAQAELVLGASVVDPEANERSD